MEFILLSRHIREGLKIITALATIAGRQFPAAPIIRCKLLFFPDYNGAFQFARVQTYMKIRTRCTCVMGLPPH